LKKERKPIGEAMHRFIEKKKELDKDIDEYKNDLDNLKSSKEETQKNLDPVVQSKKQEF
jgi:prefoldin subunit 5